MARSKNRCAAVVSRRGHEHVDDLPELINRPVHIPPATRDLHMGLVHRPAISHGVAAWPGGLGQQRREPQHPAIDRDVVDLDAALGEQLLDVAVRQTEAQIPADRQDDHVGWEAEAGEGRPRNGSRARASSHASSVATRAPSQPMQQCPDALTSGQDWLCRTDPPSVSRRPRRGRGGRPMAQGRSVGEAGAAERAVSLVDT